MLRPVRLKEPAAQRELGEHANPMSTLSCERALLRQPQLKNLVHTKLRFQLPWFEREDALFAALCGYSCRAHFAGLRGNYKRSLHVSSGSSKL